MGRFWAGTVVAVASTAALALGGCATTGTLAGGPGSTYTPLVAGWEQFFKINWEPVQRQGRPYVSGYVMNDFGFPTPGGRPRRVRTRDEPVSELAWICPTDLAGVL